MARQKPISGRIKMQELSEKEINYIIEYTGLEEVLSYPLDKTPIVFFQRNNNIIDFITLMSDNLNKIEDTNT